MPDSYCLDVQVHQPDGFRRPAGLDDAHPDDEIVIRVLDDHGYSILAEFKVADLVGREDKCFRCSTHVVSRVEVAYVDGSESTECDDGMVHEIDPPDGWDE